MPPFRNPSLRYLFGRRPVPFWQYQRRWARVHDVRFLATHGVQEKILDRYKDKLDRKAREEGHKTVTDLKDAYREKIANLRKQAVVPSASGPLGAIKSMKSPFQPPPPPVPLNDDNSATESSSSFPPGIQNLSSFIDIPKTLDLPQKEIEYIWRLRHSSNPNSLCAIVPSVTYTTMAETARKHPQFILPLPRESEDPQGQKQGGAEIHFMQWTFPHPSIATVLFTHLAEYKLHGEYATPHTTVSLHLELAEPKGLVLVQGQVQENRGVSVDEAKWLLMCLQKFYGVQGGPERIKLLEQFTNGDESFNVQQLLEETERI